MDDAIRDVRLRRCGLVSFGSGNSLWRTIGKAGIKVRFPKIMFLELLSDSQLTFNETKFTILLLSRQSLFRSETGREADTWES